jgi:hypothetical protein
VPLAGSALRDHLNLAARRIIEIGCLVCRSDFEFFDALRRSRHDTRGRSTRGCRADKPRLSGARRPGHVVAVVAAIELISVLIPHCSGDLTSGGNAWLQHEECIGITPQDGEQL